MRNSKHSIPRKSTRPLVAILLLCLSVSARGEELLIAVATNFQQPMIEIAREFETGSEHKIKLAFGSSGQLYSQILNGAPYSAFFSADIERPQLLESRNLGVQGSRFTYAVGRLALWRPDQSKNSPLNMDSMKSNIVSQNRIAIANPKLAPYGKAAQEVLETFGLWPGIQGKVVKGDNINQAFHFVHTGNAEIGLISYSQIKRPDSGIGSKNDFVLIPQNYYTPIEQQAITLSSTNALSEFIAFFKSEASQRIIRMYGYDV